jgi:hypothetical protein
VYAFGHPPSGGAAALAVCACTSGAMGDQAMQHAVMRATCAHVVVRRKLTVLTGRTSLMVKLIVRTLIYMLPP